MNGRDLAQAVRIRRPEVLVLFVSGDVGETEVPTSPLATAFLQNPLTMNALTRAVRAVLGATHSEPVGDSVTTFAKQLGQMQ